MELYCQKDIDESAPVVTSYLENETQKLRALKEMKSKVLNKSKGGSDQFCTVVSGNQSSENREPFG